MAKSTLQDSGIVKKDMIFGDTIIELQVPLRLKTENEALGHLPEDGLLDRRILPKSGNEHQKFQHAPLLPKREKRTKGS